MKYLEWNNIVASYFFNPGNAGKEIHLYITKNDIIQLGKDHLEDYSSEEIWIDFINSIKRGIQGSHGNIIARAKFAHSKNNLLYNNADGSPGQLDGIPVIFPPYILYLVFLVLPLIETVDNTSHTKRSNNYYDRLNDFLKKHNINDYVISTTDFNSYQTNSLWEDLSKWTNKSKNGDWGLFNLVPFSNPNWVYVGKVFSQCVLPPKFLNRLPELFKLLGLVPQTYYDDSFLKEKLIASRSELIPKNTLDFLKKDDELTNSIIQTIQRNYLNWKGETHEELEVDSKIRKKRNYTIAPLFLQFKLNINDESISFSYRIYSTNDFPEDLKFNEINNIYEINGWSKPLLIDFNEGVELKDKFNKWIAKFRTREIRLFKSGANFQLSNDYWIETDFLSKTERMFLLCNNDIIEKIKTWGKTFEIGKFKQEDFEGIPTNYSIFSFINPNQGLEEFTNLRWQSEKRIELIGGLKFNFRTYVSDFLPEIEVINSDGYEKVYLEYKLDDCKIPLSKHTSLNNRWILPKDITLNDDFHIKIENETLSGNNVAYSLISTNETAIRIESAKLPKRDFFGKIIELETNQYCVGSNIINPDKASQRYFSPYGSLFTSTFEENLTQLVPATINNQLGNHFSYFLSLKKELSTEEFFKAFEFYYSKEFPNQEQNYKFKIAHLKRDSLNYYDFIGILDFEYETKKIILNPPQFIFIPSNKGRKVLLIGARDAALLEQIRIIAPKYNLQVEITKQFPSNERLLLPDVVSIKSFKQTNDNFGETCLKKFAEELKIPFTSDYFPQVAMQFFSGTIYDYENSLVETDEMDFDWARYIFNPETLKFEKSETETFDKSYSLIKYKLNEHTYLFKLWQENKCFSIDLNWGRFLVLKHFEKHTILFDNINNKVAIPASTPLPRLLSESIMLLSGKAPDFQEIDGKKFKVYENVVGIFTQNLFKSKLGQIAINKNL
jgi:hypothetical protein